MLLLAACSSSSKATPTPTAKPATQVASTGGTASPTAAAAQAAAKFPGTRGASVATGLLGAIPNSPPRATATPLPAGQTPTPAPPAATPPAAKKQQVAFYVDTVTAGAGESPFNVDANLSCVRTSTFTRGMHVVWRLMAFDNTGTELQPANTDSIVLHIAGKDVTFRYGRHGPTDTSPWFWTATFDIPMDFALGTVDYSIDAKTKSGLSGTFKEIPVANPASGVESRLQVVS